MKKLIITGIAITTMSISAKAQYGLVTPGETMEQFNAREGKYAQQRQDQAREQARDQIRASEQAREQNQRKIEADRYYEEMKKQTQEMKRMNDEAERRRQQQENNRRYR